MYPIAAHPLIGCDKVEAYFGIGKVKAVKDLQTGYQFHIICNTDSDMGEIIKEVTSYIAVCYSTSLRPGDMKPDVLYRVWDAKRKGKERGVHSA